MFAVCGELWGARGRIGRILASMLSLKTKQNKTIIEHDANAYSQNHTYTHQPMSAENEPVTVAVAKPCEHLYPRYGDRISSRETGSCIRIELGHRTAAGGRGPSGRHAGTGLWKRYPRIGPQSLSGPRSKSCAADI